MSDSFVSTWPSSSVYGISQAGILEWVAISSSRGLSDPEIRPASPALSGRFFAIESRGKLPEICVCKVARAMDCSPPASSVHRILQAGILEWVARPSSRAM